jgi:hypothetical protein
MNGTNMVSQTAKWVGRSAIVFSSTISVMQGYNAYKNGDSQGVKKAGLDFGVGLGTAAMGGIPGLTVYGIYLVIMQPPIGNNSGYKTPQNPQDHTSVVFPVSYKLK